MPTLTPKPGEGRGVLGFGRHASSRGRNAPPSLICASPRRRLLPASLLATLLSAVGLYGVLAYAVSQRAREIGVRVALGAQRRDVLGMVVRQGTTLAAGGLVVGILVALASGRVMASLLFGVAPGDPVALGGAAALLMLVATAACAIPAWRAVRVAPAEALRSE